MAACAKLWTASGYHRHLARQSESLVLATRTCGNRILAGADMVEVPHRQKPYEKPTGERRGLLIVNTGDGKGKTTAAIGLAVRAHGRGKPLRFFQFMKVGVARFGEHRALEQLGIKLEGLGDGFSWKSKDLERSAELAREGWIKAAEVIASGDYFLVVLDELTYPLLYGWIEVPRVVEALKSRPGHVHVVITGRRCPAELIEIADTVTEMTMIKHAFKAGVPAQHGIEH
jgi:cob(I)alamin adenosyltransferase